MHAAQKGTGGTVCLRGHTASVGDDHIGSIHTGRRVQAALTQCSANDLSIGATGAAAKVFNVIFCHVASLEQMDAL